MAWFYKGKECQDTLGFREDTTCRDVRIYEAMPRPTEQWEWKAAKTAQLIRAFESSEGATKPACVVQGRFLRGTHILPVRKVLHKFSRLYVC